MNGFLIQSPLLQQVALVPVTTKMITIISSASLLLPTKFSTAMGTFISSDLSSTLTTILIMLGILLTTTSSLTIPASCMAPMSLRILTWNATMWLGKQDLTSLPSPPPATTTSHSMDYQLSQEAASSTSKSLRSKEDGMAIIQHSSSPSSKTLLALVPQSSIYTLRILVQEPIMVVVGLTINKLPRSP